MLTRQQARLLHFIAEHLARTDGIAPAFTEMADALNLRSKSGIHRIVTALEERGFIRRHHNRARAIEVIRLPQPMTADPGTDLVLIVSGMLGKYGRESTIAALRSQIAWLGE